MTVHGQQLKQTSTHAVVSDSHKKPNHGAKNMTQQLMQTFDSNARWTAKAVSDDETRSFMQHVEIDEWNGSPAYVATDGRRLHVAKANDKEFKPGDGWQPAKITKTYGQFTKMDSEKYQFPNWRRVIPTDLEPESIELKIPEMRNKSDYGAISIAACELVRFLGDDASVNLEYIADLAGFTWKVQIDTKRKILVFTCGETMLAVIACMMRDKPERIEAKPAVKNLDTTAVQATETAENVYTMKGTISAMSAAMASVSIDLSKTPEANADAIIASVHEEPEPVPMQPKVWRPRNPFTAGLVS